MAQAMETRVTGEFCDPVAMDDLINFLYTGELSDLDQFTDKTSLLAIANELRPILKKAIQDLDLSHFGWLIMQIICYGTIKRDNGTIDWEKMAERPLKEVYEMVGIKRHKSDSMSESDLCEHLAKLDVACGVVGNSPKRKGSEENVQQRPTLKRTKRVNKKLFRSGTCHLNIDGLLENDIIEKEQAEWLRNLEMSGLLPRRRLLGVEIATLAVPKQQLVGLVERPVSARGEDDVPRDMDVT